VFAWVDAGRDFLLGVIATVSGFLEAYLGIYTQRDTLLFPGDSVLEAPPLAPRGGNFQIQATGVRQFVWLLLGLCLLAGDIVEGHVGGNYFRGCGVAPNVAPCCPRMSMYWVGR
jgi:hypothetical protein